jgi:hypothetical protein
MLQEGVVTPSRSPWSSPIVLVNKRNGEVRFCVDYRRLNTITKKDVYPLPRIDDSLNALGCAKYFSTFDLASGYWQIPMTEADKEKTAFTSHYGLFQFEVMPFGLCNAPATFQRHMDLLFAGLKWTSCLIYLNDIIVFSPTFEDHLKDLRQVFMRLQDANLQLKPTKCSICQPELLYLGHKISAEGIIPDPNKIQAIKEMPAPKDKSEVRSFLGLCSYNRKFIPNFAFTSEPLNAITREQIPFTWGQQQKDAFDSLKQSLTQSPILRHPDFNEPFLIQTDACDMGLGAVLCQQINDCECVIQYASRTQMDY